MFFEKRLIKMNSSHTVRLNSLPTGEATTKEEDQPMYKFKNSLIAFAGLSLLIGAIALVTPDPAMRGRH